MFFPLDRKEKIYYHCFGMYLVAVVKEMLCLILCEIANMNFILTEKHNNPSCQTGTNRRSLRGASLCRDCCCPPFLMMSCECWGDNPNELVNIIRRTGNKVKGKDDGFIKMIIS